MRLNRFASFLLFCVGFWFASCSAIGQSLPAASRGVVPSAFFGLTGTYTGLNGGRNLGISAGVDVGFKPFFGLLPSVEVRGSYPIKSGQVAGEEYVAGGLRVQKRYGAFRPYADFLFGRGEVNYQNGGFAVPMQAFRYLQTTGDVVSPGFGVEVDATPQLALLIDVQAQIWQVPFDPSGSTSNAGHIVSVPGTLGVVYRFNWLQHGHAAP